MPRRQSGSRPAPRSAAQSRGAHTAAASNPHAHTSTPAHAPPAPPATATAQQSQGPGLLGQMAATAGSVAVGSTIGHGLSNMLFGSSGVQAQDAQTQEHSSSPSCGVQAKDFTNCLEKADLQSCSYYLEQLKACQAAAAPY